MLDEDARRTNIARASPEHRREFLASTLALTAAPQGHSVLRHDFSRPFWVLFVATVVLLALACLNVAGLFLARGSARHREISTRLALGASRGRIGRQLLADSVLLAFTGGLLGIVMAPLAVRALITFLPRNTAATGLEANVDTRVLLFALLVSLVTGFLAGCVPALQAGRKSLESSLRERGGTPSGGLSLRRGIVTAQIAFTLILVVAAGLFIQTLHGLLAKGPGFETSSLISFGIRPALNGYSGAEETQLIRRISEGIRDSASTQASAIALVQLLLGGAWSNSLTIQSVERFTTDREVQMNAVTSGFFATLGARIVAGRDFNEHDSLDVALVNQSLPVSKSRQRVVIVNEAFVKRYFGGRSPLGAHVAMGSQPDAKPDTEIIGVVENISYRNVREQWEQAYFPIGTELSGSNFYVRFRGTPESAFRSIRAILHNADPSLPITYFRTLDEQVDESLNTERMLSALSSSFGTVALLLSLVGLYGVISFVVTQRTREIGIRLALGATRLSAVWLVLRDALVMIAGGTAIALPCVWALGRLVESELYGVKPDRPGDDRRSNFGSVLDSAGRSVDSRAPRVDRQPHRRTSIRVGNGVSSFAPRVAFRTSWDKVFDAVEHVVSFGLKHRVLGQIDAIGVDEIQYAKGRKYLTLVYQIDLDVTRLLWVGRERTIESFRVFFTVIGDELASKIVFICSDMWEPT